MPGRRPQRVWRCPAILIALLLALAGASGASAEGDSGIREYKLYHERCSGGDELYVGQVLVKHAGGKSRGKFQPAFAAEALGCPPGTPTRAKLTEEGGSTWISPFVACPSDKKERETLILRLDSNGTLFHFDDFVECVVCVKNQPCSLKTSIQVLRTEQGARPVMQSLAVVEQEQKKKAEGGFLQK
ncbi:hypothetical protein DFJ74DRAFT_681467 [Hyaloraphidium curvatum]|nr:hypothetical protein DFJ74DRAFT_681467 [Hyaloraphidium curvatum]